MNNFNDRLVLAREKAGLSQKRLAELLQITPTRLNYWEKGKREPNVLMIKNISKILKVSSDFLIFGEENSNCYTSHEVSVLNKYRRLNSKGKPKAETYIDDLLVNPQYTVPDDLGSAPEEHIELKLVAENKNSVPPIVDDITHT